MFYRLILHINFGKCKMCLHVFLISIVNCVRLQDNQAIS